MKNDKTKFINHPKQNRIKKKFILPTASKLNNFFKHDRDNIEFRITIQKALNETFQNNLKIKNELKLFEKKNSDLIKEIENKDLTILELFDYYIKCQKYHGKKSIKNLRYNLNKMKKVDSQQRNISHSKKKYKLPFYAEITKDLKIYSLRKRVILR
jgi:hypothetical protein